MRINQIINLKLGNYSVNPSIWRKLSRREITMTGFVHTAHPAQHPGVVRAQSALRTARQFRKNFDSTKGLAAMLLAAIVAALLVVANQMVENWSDGHLLAAWVILWAVAFAALGLCASTARQLAARTVARFDAWSQRVARARADARLVEAARHDRRIMAELQALLSHQDVEVDAPTQAPAAGWLSPCESMQDWRNSDKAAPAARTQGCWMAPYEPALHMLRGAPND